LESLTNQAKLQVLNRNKEEMLSEFQGLQKAKPEEQELKTCGTLKNFLL